MLSQSLYGPAKRGFLQRVLVAATCGVIAGAGGCSTEAMPRGEGGLAVRAAGGGTLGETAVAQPRGDRPPALVGNTPVTWEEMQPLLAEMAGGAVLEEILLDRALEAELAERGIRLDDEAVAQERNLLLKSVAEAAGATPDVAVALLEELRRTRGLGERRFAALLRRNAALRRLVRDEVVITEEDLRTGYQVQHGPKHRARLIVTATDRAAAQALARVRGEGEEPAEVFGSVAAEISTDSSAARGGLIEPFSLADPRYPVALREALRGLQVGEISGVVALDGGFAIVKLEEIIPGSGRPMEEVRGEVEAELRLIRERAAMDALASRLVRSSRVIVMDRSLDWSWTARLERNR